VVKLADRSDTVMWFLEKTLAHGCHCFFIFTDFLGYSHKHAEFGRQVDVLSLLLNLKQWLVKVHYLFVVLLFEVKNHRNCCTSFTLIKLARRRTHIKANIADFISLMMAIASHHNRTFELIINIFLNFLLLRSLVLVALLLSDESCRLFVNQIQAVVD
jgi:hypothetical protein